MKKAREGIEQRDYYPEPDWVTRRGKVRFLYRALTGRPMDGVRWTDSTFWRSATRGEDHGWLRLAGWQRALIRLTVTYALLLLLPAYYAVALLSSELNARVLLAAHVLLWAGAAAPVLLYRVLRNRGLVLPLPQRVHDAERGSAWRWSRRTVLHGRKEWLEQKVLPVARTVAATTNRRYHPAEVEQWVSVPRNYREPGAAAVEILLPGDFHLAEAARKRMALSVGERLGMRDPQYSYELEGNAPRLLLTAPVLPPPLVLPQDVMAELEQSEEYTFVLGKSGSSVLRVSLKEDSPHIAVSAGSGAGKSEQIKGLIAQAMHWGWSVIVLDWKGESQEWVEHFPGVRYVRQIDDLHDMMVSIGEEIEKRRLLRDKEQRAKLPRILVISEEWSITAPLLQSYWTQLRSTAEPEERRVMPLKSPAIEAGMKLNFTGRSLGFCQLLVAIRFSARVTNGNADLRESFGIVLMSRWKGQTVKMLAPDIRPFPKKITTPGRWVAVNGDEAVVYQAVLWDDETARNWATNGQLPAASPWSVRTPVGMGQQSNVSTMQPPSLEDPFPRGVTGGSVATSPMPMLQLRKLSEMVDTLANLGVTQKSLQHMRDRDEDFPLPRGGTRTAGWLYDLKEVTDYVRRRRAIEAAEKAGR